MVKLTLTYLLFTLLTGLFFTACGNAGSSSTGDSVSKIDSLEQQVKLLIEKSKEATVVRRVSEQLEEIAYQQKDISDAQRQEALFQKKEAEQMRSLAELENERAQVARQEALAAYSQMEEQKKLADVRREEAVRAQLKTDTLARLALGRSLATQSLNLNRTDNHELAELLAFSGWTFTKEYNGDLYQSAIFDALNQVSGSSLSLSEHRGAVRDLCMVETDQKKLSFASISQWGEIILWTKNGESFDAGKLFSNDRYDFRCVSYSSEFKKLIAASYNGELVVLSGGQFQETIVIPTESTAVLGLDVLGNSAFFVTKAGMVSRISISESITKATRRLVDEKLELKPIYNHRAPICCQVMVNDEIWLGDENGTVTRINLQGEVLSSLQIRKGVPLTAIGVDSVNGICAYGFKDGTIRTVAGSTTQEYIEHLSSVNALVWNNEGLVSASNDCTVRFWPRKNEENQSLVVLTSQSWIYSAMLVNEGKWVISGGASNMVLITPVSPFTMAESIHRSLTREFTPQEWSYYIGEVAPYRTFK